MVAPLAFAVTVAAVGVTTLAAYYAHASLAVALLAAVALAVAGGVWAWRAGARLLPAPAPHDGPLPWVLAGVAALLSLFEGAWFALGADTFYHLAAARSLLATGRPLPTDPFYGTPAATLDPTSGAWHALLAGIAGLTRLDVSLLWAPLAVVCSALFALALYTLAENFTRSPTFAAVAVGLIFALRLALDVRAMAYPNRGSLVLLVITIWALSRLAEDRGWELIAIAVASGLAGALVHLATAEFAFVAVAALLAGSIVAAIRDRVSGVAADWWATGRLAVAGGLLGVAALPAVMPRLSALSGANLDPANFDMAATFVRAPLGVMVPRVGWLVGFGARYAHASRLLSEAWLLAVAAIVVLALVAAWRNGSHTTFALAALVAIPVALVVPPIGPIAAAKYGYMLARLVGIASYLPFFGIAWLLTRPSELGRVGRPAGIVAVAFAAFLMLPAAVTTFSPALRAPGSASVNVSEMWASDIRYQWGAENISAVRKWAGKLYPRVGADPKTGYALAGLAPVTVIAVPATHSPWGIEKVDGPARRLAALALVSPRTTPAERIAVAGRYRLDGVAISRGLTPGFDAAVVALKPRSGVLGAGAYLARDAVVDTHELVVYATWRTAQP